MSAFLHDESRKSGQSLKPSAPANPLLRLLAVNGAAGVAISLLMLAGLLAADVGHLRSLIVAAQDPVVPLVLLAGGLIVTMTSVVMGTAIMMLGSSDEDSGDRKGRGRRSMTLLETLIPHRQPEIVPVPVRVTAGRRQTDRRA